MKKFQSEGPVNNCVDPSSGEEVYPYLHCIEKGNNIQQLYPVKIDKTNISVLRIHLTFLTKIK